MSVALVTGAGGLIGSETVTFLIEKGMEVVGIDNDMRSYYFGPEASTSWRLSELSQQFKGFRNASIDIRDFEALRRLVSKLGNNLALIVHTAAQPSHDWAAREPFTDFSVNAQGTLNVLEAARQGAPNATIIFTSTNKVYGDTPNNLPLIEQQTRWEVATDHPYHQRGIDETMSVDRSTHSLFGISKLSADLMVQEYGRYFGMNTVCFRGGCLTGGGHSGTELHGFLAYLMKCVASGRNYTIYGYKGKQVRDNIHAHDLVNAFWAFFDKPAPAQVYNIGGSRYANVSMLEAIALCEDVARRKLSWTYTDDNRTGDHIWWVSDISAFQRDYPNYRLTYDIQSTIEDIYEHGRLRWTTDA